MTNMFRFGRFGILFLVCTSCLEKVSDPIDVPTSETPVNSALNFKPNILWLVAEDMSSTIPAFGDSTIVTPTLDALAREGICYDNFFTPAPVCAPARSAIITGMYPNHIGSNHMRTGPWYGGRPSPEGLERSRRFMPEGLIPYEATPEAGVKMFPEYLRAAGYYTANHAKEDYQFLKTHIAWDESGRQAHWRNREAGQPFFAVFNFGVTHESRIWAKKNDSLWVDADLSVPVPPYLPDTEVGRADVRRMYSNILEMDQQVGEVLRQLEEDGLLDSTIVMWYTDHGGPLPRQKRSLHDSGIKVPLIIRFPEALGGGTRDNRFTSFIDLAPTVLSLAGINEIENMDGTAFLGQFIRQDNPPYVFAAADRFDASYDQSRAVRDGQYKYIRNYRPQDPMFLQVAYRDQMDIMQELYRLRDGGNLNETQSIWFGENRPKEQLFDVQSDPHEINDLANDPQYIEKLIELREVNDRFTEAIGDKGLIPEEELLASIWPNQMQPVTADPSWSLKGDSVVVYCETPGASLGYQIITSEGVAPTNWMPYVGPIARPAQGVLKVKASRIGFMESNEIDVSLNQDSSK